MNATENPLAFSFEQMPGQLRERCRWIVPASQRRQPTFVMYWMHHALRGHENPALDVAIAFATSLDLSLLVYHGLGERYPYASDRHHTFILQGARDVERELGDRGIRHVFHLARKNHYGPHLKQLARQATLLVTDEMPVEPIRGWFERLEQSTQTPIVAVDTSCLVPMQSLTRHYERAYEFREATKRQHAGRVGQPWPERAVTCRPYDGPLPFKPVSLVDADFDQLVAECKIDHSVPPVAETTGGSIAGYERWERFRDQQLADYDRERNDAARDATSRMSPYLHYGMVSPFRLAREADARGAAKFLDELLVWRELGYNFCFHHDDPDAFSLLPDWAAQSLREHASDSRDATFTWEQLARGKTGDRLWDAAQTSLVRRGELHNNVRMTWGKMLLRWTRTPEQALCFAIDLNHRFALDGRDPASYGGLRWCLGQFDRPFKPVQPIYGAVRIRSTEEHARRLDIERFETRTGRTSGGLGDARIAIVGAGLAGLVAARVLVDQGADVTLFDKSRSVGGRMASRRIEGHHPVDHGAQYFTARDPRFMRLLRSWVDAGIARPWEGRIVKLHEGQVIEENDPPPRYVGVPDMNHVARHLADGLTVVGQTRITRLSQIGREGAWQLYDEGETSHGEFTDVILNMPAPQAFQLLPTQATMRREVASVDMQPCWVCIVRTPDLKDVPFDGAFVTDPVLSWLANNQTKPQRDAKEARWVLHATAEWSAANIDAKPDHVIGTMLRHLKKATRLELREVNFALAHRWRFAKPAQSLDTDHLWDSQLRIGACGDWCGGPRIEGAFLSGVAMAGRLLRQYALQPCLPRA